MVEQRQGFSVPSAVLPNTVPQVLPKREYASSFSSDPEFDLLLACCACDEKVERVQNAPHWQRFCTGTSPHVSLPISIFSFHPTTCRRSELALPNWVTKQASSFPHVKSGPTSRRVMNWCLISASTGICSRFNGESCLV